MQAGKLNRQIIIQSKTVAANALNEKIETWATYKTVWANVITSGGKEFYAAQKMYAETSAVFVVRYNAAFTVQMRILYGTRIFEILALNEIDGMRTELQLIAKEVI